MRVSIVIPVYNEEPRLRKVITRVEKAIERITKDYEVIIAEDGSIDGTDRLARQIGRENPKVIHLHSDERLGRGEALKRAFKRSKGEILVYMDSDLATDLKHLKELISFIENGAQFSTGSRLLPESGTRRSVRREIASRTYNLLVRTLFGIPIHDMQCGFKAFERKALFDILDDIEDKHWFWDTECLVRAYKKGYKVVEFPVRWKDKESSKVNFVKDSMRMGTKLVMLWWKLEGFKWMCL
ncbi:glycosyltransferase family 2 protein [Candidatus Micrarchaeota archaeon]|nr:glycosyltransferase family 2 protein [Candidatus Micrarchaeota archaeon]